MSVNAMVLTILCVYILLLLSVMMSANERLASALHLIMKTIPSGTMAGEGEADLGG